jgi:hypothetical protein
LFSSPSQELLVARTGTILTANSPGAFCIVSLSLSYIQSRYSALTLMQFVARWSVDGRRCQILYGSCLLKGFVQMT